MKKINSIVKKGFLILLLFSLANATYSQYAFTYNMKDGSTAKIEISIDDVNSPTKCRWGYGYKLHINYKITFSSATHNSLSVLNITSLHDNKGKNHTATLNDKTAGEHSDETASTWTSDHDCATITPSGLNLGSLTLKIQENGGTEQNPVLSAGSGTYPIKLIVFTAQTVSEGIKIFWKTASEDNNSYFTIERSKDNQNWEEIAKLEGAGNSNQELEYNFIDENPIAGSSYYRLKQTDYDGTSTYSKVFVLKPKKISKSNIAAYPNPTSDKIILLVNDINMNEIFIINVLGQNIIKQIPISQNTENQFVLSLKDLPKGIYLIQTPKESIKVYKQ